MNDHANPAIPAAPAAARAAGIAKSRPLYLRHARAVRDHALDQRRRADADADERAADLQCPSGVVLGRFVVQRTPGVARNRREGERAGQPGRIHARARSRIHDDRRARRFVRRRPDVHAGISVMADRAEPPVARDGPLVAFLLRLDLPDQRALLRRVHDLRVAISRATCCRRATTFAASARRSSITCAFVIRRARPRSATTCCRSSRTSSSSSSCCR